jgi:predicted GNAT superfamily acetyltransferase
MNSVQSIVGRATDLDLDGILELQAANQIGRGGALSASFSRSRLTAMMREMPVIVARQGRLVTGFLLTATREMNRDLPVVQVMWAAYEGAPNAYVYGPVCISIEERGQGLARAMFDMLRTFEPGREGVLFIRRDNQISLKAHFEMGMVEVAEFRFNGFEFAVFSYIG